MLKKLLLATALASLTFVSGPANAQFPERTVDIMFPWTAGAAMSCSQIIAKGMADELGVAVPVISTPGAAGMKAFKTAMGRKSDGYTIYDGYVAPLVLQPVLGKANWTYKDFKPLHSGVSNAFSIGSRVGDTRWNTIEELMAYGKKNPGKLRYSSGSRNNLPHMVMAKVLQSYGVVAQNIPYKTDGDARKDLQAGVLDFAFVNVGAYLQDKKGFKILLVLSELPGAKASYDGAPSIADLKIDLGLSGLAPMGWDWWLVSKDTPEAETKILRKAMKAAMANPDVIAKISKIGFVPLKWDYDEYDKIVGPVADQLGAMGNALKWEEEEMKKLR